MAKSEETVKQEIKNFIDSVGGNHGNWYVGITDDPEDRLFNEHNVDEEDDYTYEECYTSDASRRVEDYFVNTLGTDGDVGGGDEDSVYVYAYKKTEETVE